MKKKIIFLIFILLFFCPVVNADVTDGDLELWESNYDLTHWEESTIIKYYSSSEYRYHPKIYSPGYISQQIDCSYAFGTVYQVSCDVYSSYASSCKIQTTFYNASSELSTTSTTFTTPSTWGTVTHTSIIPSDTETVLIKIYPTGSEPIWVDKVKAGNVESSDLSFFQLRDELDMTNIISNFTLTIYNDTQSVTFQSSDNQVMISNSTLSNGEYTIKYDSENYYPRWYNVITPCVYIGYVPPVNESISLVGFSIIDYTGQFTYLSTNLKITKPTDTGTITVSENIFSASGLSQHYLIQNEPYFLELVTEGYTRGMGTFIPTSSETINLVVGDIEILPGIEAYDGFNYNLKKTNTSISMNWIAPSGSLNEAFNYSIYDKNDTLVYSLSSSSPNGTATYEYGDPEEQYKISIIANTTVGILRHTEYITGEGNLIDLQISDLWYNMISIFLLFIFALCFGYKHASAGAFIVSICATGFALFGLLRISVLIVALCVYLGILAIFRGRGA